MQPSISSHRYHLRWQNTFFNTTQSYGSFHSSVLKYAVAERKARFISYLVWFPETGVVNNESETHSSSLYGLPCFGRDQLLLSATPRNWFQVYWFTYRLTGRSCQEYAAESLETDQIERNQRGNYWVVEWLIGNDRKISQAQWLHIMQTDCWLILSDAHYFNSTEGTQFYGA